MNNSLGITVGAVTMTAGLQLFPQFRVIVDFSIEYDPGSFVFVADRLVSSREIHNTEPPHA
jgi:hypothetical protein